MSENQPGRPALEQPAGKFRTAWVGQVAVISADPAFEKVRVTAHPQKLGVVVCLEQRKIAAAHAVVYFAGHLSQIGGHRNFLSSRQQEAVADASHAVMRRSIGAHLYPRGGKGTRPHLNQLGPGIDKCVLLKIAQHRRSGINRRTGVFCQDPEPLDMISVLMGQEDSSDFAELLPQIRKASGNSSAADSRIDKQRALPAGYVSAVAGARACQHTKSCHPIPPQ